jgi:hypothetical protein
LNSAEMHAKTTKEIKDKKIKIKETNEKDD